MKKLRIAFLHMPGTRWTAGLHYLKNLFTALRSLETNIQPEILLLVAKNNHPDSYDDLQSYIDRTIFFPTDPAKTNFWRRQSNRITKRLGYWPRKEHFLSIYLRQQGVDALFSPYRTYGAGFYIPLLSWITDFQHRHLPEMFPETSIRNRDKKYRHIAKNATRVILSSHDALNDFSQFAPQYVQKARIYSFVAQIPAEVYDDDPAEICQTYHLPERFFFLPNQFWQHKNHGLVIQAIATAKAQSPDLTVVCTGNTNEFRSPNYFGTLLSRISTLGIRDNMIVLGFIPQNHLFQLMRQSLAILQPSLFEGWSTTVEEAKSLGKKLVISDIPVHREQNPREATFFDPHNPLELADILSEIHRDGKSGADKALETEAKKELPVRTQRSGQLFLEIVEEAVNSSGIN